MKKLKEDLNSLSNTEGISTNQQLLHLMQVHDSAFPIGSYTQSFGMETYIQKEKIRTKADLLSFCQSYLQHNLACGDAIVVKEVYQLLQKQDFNKIERLEGIIHAMKLASESREGSIMIGRQFLKTVLPLQRFKQLEEWQERIENRKAKGHFAVIYGMYAACQQFHLDVTVMTFLYSSVTALIHNAVRVVPFGQNTGVACIHELLPIIEQATKTVLSYTLDDLSNRSIGIEIASMEHQSLYSRLFIS